MTNLQLNRFQDYISTSKRMELLQDFYETTLVTFGFNFCF